MKQEDIMQHASKKFLVFLGSLLAFALTLKTVGIDFAPIIHAKSQSIIAKIESESDKRFDILIEQNKELRERLIEIQSSKADFEHRLEHVESLAHKSGVKH